MEDMKHAKGTRSDVRRGLRSSGSIESLPPGADPDLIINSRHIHKTLDDLLYKL